MKIVWEMLYDIDFITRRIESIRNNIIHNLYYEIDNETGFAKVDPETSEPILSGMSKKECTRIANGRASKIKRSLKYLYKRHKDSTQFNFAGGIAYYNYNAGAHFLYHFNRLEDGDVIKNTLSIFDLHSDGAPIESLYPGLNSSDLNSFNRNYNSYLAHIKQCYENHKRVSLPIRQFCRHYGYVVERSCVRCLSYRDTLDL